MSDHQFATDDDLDLAPPRRTRLLVIVLVVIIHVAAIFGLIRAFAPRFVDQVADTVLSTFNVTITAPPPPPPPPEAPEKSGAAAEVGKKAVPREAASPKPKLAIAQPTAAPPIAGKGPDNSAGARDTGSGTGAGGQGNGTGSGAGGTGQGGGAASKAVKIAGEINSTRDLPASGREARQGSFVNVALTVGADGRVRGCRIFRASGDPEADSAVCRLAVDRFRFRPAMDRDGNPVESVFGWQQRYCPGKGDCSRIMR